MLLRQVLILNILFLAGNSFLSAEEVSSELRLKLFSIYKTIDSTLRSNSKSYQATPPDNVADGNFELVPKPWTPKSYEGGPSRGAWMQVWADNLQLRLVLNAPLSQLIDQKKITQTIPNLKLEEVIDVAKSYLRSFHLNLDSNLQLTTVSFNRNYPSCWEVRWTRFAQEYPWDDFNQVLSESVVVVFHETEGVLCVGNEIYSPMPASLKVSMTRGDAIEKASKCAPLVELTPFYKSSRVDGFIISELKSCDLKIAIPNYLLDPKRAKWLSKVPPDKTRLCWVVRFATVDSKTDQHSTTDKPIPPDIIIYLDAATGECVGANFS